MYPLQSFSEIMKNVSVILVVISGTNDVNKTLTCMGRVRDVITLYYEERQELKRFRNGYHIIV